MNVFVANHVLCLSCVLAAVGWLVSFAGLCVSAAAALTHAISWWVTVYELALVIFVCSATWANAIQIYRPAILAMIAISVPYATDEIARYISTGEPPHSAASAGYIVLIVAQFSWLFLFGVQHESLSFQALESPSYSYQSNTTMPFGADSVEIPKPYPYRADPATDHTVFVSPHAEYNIPVLALHTYEANPEDPNELKFVKGETLYVHEPKGNWWQARKADGSTAGIIPANYVTPILH